MLDQPLKQWLIGGKKGEDKNPKTWISSGWKELSWWNKEAFFLVFNKKIVNTGFKDGKKKQLWKQLSWCKSEKFKVTNNFSVHIFWCWRIKKFKNKIKVHKIHKIYPYK